MFFAKIVFVAVLPNSLRYKEFMYLILVKNTENYPEKPFPTASTGLFVLFCLSADRAGRRLGLHNG
jgi:hypothetical protein